MFTLTCPSCSAELSLPARRLVVRVDEESSERGEVLFTCLSCATTAAMPIDAAAVMMLITGGVTVLSLSKPVVEHPETRPDGPAFTTDDLIDLHVELDRGPGVWVERPVHPDC